MTNHIQGEKARDYYGEFINHAKHCTQCSPSLGMFCLEGQRLRGHKVTERDWEKEFDNCFGHVQGPLMGHSETLKSFISHHLEAEREKSYRTGLEDGTLKLGETARKNYQMGYNEASQAMREKVEGMKFERLEDYGDGKFGWNNALDNVLSLLDKQTK